MSVYDGSAESVETSMAEVGRKISSHMKEAESEMYDKQSNGKKMKPKNEARRSIHLRYQRRRSRNMQKLFDSSVQVNDTAALLAICGMLMMMVDNVWILCGVYEETSIPSIGLRACVSVMTILLVGCVAYYHTIHIRLFLYTHNSDDWQLVTAIQKPLVIFIELLLYLLHPLPYVYYVTINTSYALPSYSFIKTVDVSVNVFLSVAMFSRFYLILRYLALHSTLQKHCFLLTVVPMNGVKFGMPFMCKSYLKRNTSLVLAVMAGICLGSLAWLMWMVEQRHGNVVMILPNAAWNIMITTLAVGYGDAVSLAICRRFARQKTM